MVVNSSNHGNSSPEDYSFPVTHPSEKVSNVLPTKADGDILSRVAAVNPECEFSLLIFFKNHLFTAPMVVDGAILVQRGQGHRCIWSCFK